MFPPGLDNLRVNPRPPGLPPPSSSTLSLEFNRCPKRDRKQTAERTFVDTTPLQLLKLRLTPVGTKFSSWWKLKLTKFRWCFYTSLSPSMSPPFLSLYCFCFLLLLLVFLLFPDSSPLFPPYTLVSLILFPTSLFLVHLSTFPAFWFPWLPPPFLPNSWNSSLSPYSLP